MDILFIGAIIYLLQDQPTVKKEIAVNKQYNFNRKPIMSDNGQCETEITQIYYSKTSGEITTCRGKLLEAGQTTRVVRINK